MQKSFLNGDYGYCNGEHFLSAMDGQAKCLLGIMDGLYPSVNHFMTSTSNKRIAAVAFLILFFDQFTKFLVLKYLGYAQEKVVIEGFFKFVHWGNTGAAWSMFKDNNDILAIVSLVALLVLFFVREHFNSGTFTGHVALGLLFGGIMGNLVDRLHPMRRHVIDFIYFYVNRRGGGEIGFPAFNIADSAICIGVGLLFVLSWQSEQPRPAATDQPSVQRS